MVITQQTKLAEVIHLNYQLLPILNRFNIQLGFGEQSVEEVCQSKGVNVDFFLEIVNSFQDEDYFPEANLQTFPLKVVIDYIKKSHEHYIKVKIPLLESLMHELLSLTDESNRTAGQMIEKFFKDYKEEVMEHIQNEENNVHPYVLSIDNAYSEGRINDEHRKLVKNNSIDTYADEHDNIEDKLFDLKNLIIKYMPPVSDVTVSNALLVELFRLERDLNDHSRIEDKVMIPKVQMLEREILGEEA